MTDRKCIKIEVGLIDELKDMRDREHETMHDIVLFLKREYDKSRSD